LKSEKFIKSRIRTSASIPVGGQSSLWKITRVDPCNFGTLPLHTSKLEGWTQMSKTSNDEKSKSSS
jgi:hypothetical protein